MRCCSSNSPRDTVRSCLRVVERQCVMGLDEKKGRVCLSSTGDKAGCMSRSSCHLCQYPADPCSGAVLIAFVALGRRQG